MFSIRNRSIALASGALALALALAVVGVTAGSRAEDAPQPATTATPPTPDPDPPAGAAAQDARLQGIALELARENGDQPVTRIRVVHDSPQQIADLLSPGNADEFPEEVDVVVVDGDFTANSIPIPANYDAPHFTELAIVTGSESGRVLMVSIRPAAAALGDAALAADGPVRELSVNP